MHRSFAERRTPLVFIAAALMAAAFFYSLAALAPAARADGPGSGAPWTASLGDSYISGEAGRWAGNTNMSSSTIDALGSTARYLVNRGKYHRNEHWGYEVRASGGSASASGSKRLPKGVP